MPYYSLSTLVLLHVANHRILKTAHFGLRDLMQKGFSQGLITSCKTIFPFEPLSFSFKLPVPQEGPQKLTEQRTRLASSPPRGAAFKPSQVLRFSLIGRFGSSCSWSQTKPGLKWTHLVPTTDIHTPMSTRSSQLPKQLPPGQTKLPRGLAPRWPVSQPNWESRCLCLVGSWLCANHATSLCQSSDARIRYSLCGDLWVAMDQDTHPSHANSKADGRAASQLLASSRFPMQLCLRGQQSLIQMGRPANKKTAREPIFS